MRSESIFRGVFVVYCVEAGLFLCLSPWLTAWSHALILLPFGPLRDFLLTSWVRSAISAFGLLHLVWGVHDLDLFLRRRSLVTQGLDRIEPSGPPRGIQSKKDAGQRAR